MENLIKQAALMLCTIPMLYAQTVPQSDTVVVDWPQIRVLPIFNQEIIFYKVYGPKPPDGHHVISLDKKSDVRFEGSFKDGLLDGRYVSYWSGGEVHVEAFYLKGVIHGTFTSYLDRSYYQQTYEYGVLQMYRDYDKKGRLRASFDCDNGKYGDITHYNSKGRVVSKIIRGPNNKRLSKQFFNKKGIMVKEVFFHDKH